MNDLILQDSGALAIRDSDRIECKDLILSLFNRILARNHYTIGD